MLAVGNCHLLEDSRVILDVKGSFVLGVKILNSSGVQYFPLNENCTALYETHGFGNEIILICEYEFDNEAFVSKISISSDSENTYNTGFYHIVSRLYTGIFFAYFNSEYFFLDVNNGIMESFYEFFRRRIMSSMLGVTNVELNKLSDVSDEAFKFYELIITFDRVERLHVVVLISPKGVGAYNMVYSESNGGLCEPLSNYLVDGDYLFDELFFECLFQYDVKRYCFCECDAVKRLIRRNIIGSIPSLRENTYLG